MIKLKTVQPYFDALVSRRKQFEVRFNDRDFQVGQELCLAEWDVETQRYTGNAVIAKIAYVLDNPDFCKEGYVVLQLAFMRNEWS